MSVFADSSALVKLYADEEGAAVVRELVDLIVSELARVEVPAALWRKHRGGEIDSATVATLNAAFEADYFGTEAEPPLLAPVSAAAAVFDQAARAVAEHRLRADDAVQLASAIAARAAVPQCRAFACFDADLRAAAAANGFRLIP